MMKLTREEQITRLQNEVMELRIVADQWKDEYYSMSERRRLGETVCFIAGSVAFMVGVFCGMTIQLVLG